MEDADTADDPTLLVNSPAQVECLLHSHEQVTGSIELYVDTNITKFMRLKH